ncbi:MAG TPA: oligosaccharide flippase family protein [Sphingomicrobium sp.]|nr:oligosaccharide flippase family protein [Sphingomicrobium sp.]
MIAAWWARLGAEGTLAGASFWSMVARIVGMAVTLLVGIQLARYLGPRQLGIFAILTSVTLILSIVAQLGLSALATREASVAWSERDWGRLRGVLRSFPTIVAAAGIVLGLMFAVAMQWVPGIDQEFRSGAWWAGAGVPMFALIGLYAAQLSAVDRMVAGQSIEALWRPAILAGLLLLAGLLIPGSIDASLALALNFGAMSVALASAALLLHRSVPTEARRYPPERHVRQWVHAALPLGVSHVLRQYEVNYALLILGLIASPFETGIFRVALSCAALLGVPLLVAHSSVGPLLARAFAASNYSALQSVLTNAARALFLINLLAFLLLLLVGQWLIATLFGAVYTPAWAPLLLLSAALLALSFTGGGFVLLGVSGEERPLMRCHLASAILGSLLAIVATYYYGAIGGAGATLVGALLYNILVWAVLRWKFGLDCSPIGLQRKAAWPERSASQ